MTLRLTDMYRLVEKDNEFATHAVFDSLERAERHLKNLIPIYIKRGYFSDKTLTTNSFKIIKVPA